MTGSMRPQSWLPDKQIIMARFRFFQNQPAQRERTLERQLHRFMATTSGRKARYARKLVLALDPDRVPRPLDHLLASV